MCSWDSLAEPFVFVSTEPPPVTSHLVVSCQERALRGVLQSEVHLQKPGDRGGKEVGMMGDLRE